MNVFFHITSTAALKQDSQSYLHVVWKVKKQPDEKVAYSEDASCYQNILLERSQHNFCMSQ